jgi:hypothetical protein
MYRVEGEGLQGKYVGLLVVVEEVSKGLFVLSVTS